MADQAAILKAFMMGAPLEALSVLLHIDAEDAVRRELRRIAYEASSEEADHPAGRNERKAASGTKNKARHRAPMSRSNGDGTDATPATAKSMRCDGRTAADGDELRRTTWRDTVRTALVSLGPATVDEIEAHLRECGITRPRSLISTTLGQLRDMGQVEKRGEQWVLNHG